MYYDENRSAEFNFENALHVYELNGLYKHTILKDVDFIIELEDKFIFLEYKNAKVSNANNPQAFDEKIKKDNHMQDMARKYYDSLHYFTCSINKRRIYIYIIETEKITDVDRKNLRIKIAKILPLKEEFKRLDDFDVISIKKWNKQYPLLQIKILL